MTTMQGGSPPKPTDRSAQSTDLEEKPLETVKQFEEFLTVALTDEERKRLMDIKKKWSERPKSTRSISSSEWQRTQERFLPLLCLPYNEMEEEFETRRDTLNWSYATASQYWSALIKCSETSGIPIDPQMRTQQKVFNFLKAEEDPKRPTIAATKQQVETAALKISVVSALAMKMTFALGQRIGDTLKLRAQDVTLVEDRSSGLELVALQYRRGKTTRRRGPYNVHLDSRSLLGQDILNLANKRAPGQLFCELAQQVKMLSEIRTSLQEVSTELSLLSIRRGGLQEMAQEGMSESVLLHHSRHTTREMLMRYLEWGKFALDAARERYGKQTRDTPLEENGQN